MKKLLPLVCVLIALLSCSKKQERAAAQPQFRNLLVITIDTLRADALQPYGGSAPTPFLQEFAQKSVVFAHAFTSAPITLPAHASLFSGLYPPSHGVRNNGSFRAPATLKLMAEFAKESGMKTGAVIGGYPLAAQFGLNQGFQTYDDAFPPSDSAGGVFLYTEKNAEQVRLRAEQIMGSGSTSPYFLWLHFFDPHHPYREHGMQNVTPYHQEIAYVDGQLGLFFEFLKSRRLLENTLTFITSDHGEAFGEHGEVSHTLFVYNTTLRIPLMMNGPGIAGGRRSELVRLIDVMPTVLEAFAWKTDARMDGASLFPLLQGQPTPPRDSYAESFAPALDFGWSPLASIQDLKGKYIRAPKPEFYDLQADPNENSNLAPAGASGPYEEKVKQVLARTTAAASHDPTPEDRERLASIGYLSGSAAKMDWSGADPKDRVATAREIAELTAVPSSPAEKAKRYEAIASREPSNPLLLLRYAELLLELKKYREAQSVFQRVLDLKYLTPAVYNGLATATFHRNQPDAAENLLKQAIEAGAADGETHYNLAELLLQHGNRQEAFRQLDRCIAINYAPAFYRKARLLDVIEGSEKALALLAEAQARFPYDMRAHFEAGMIRFRRRQYAPAARDFEQALALAPGDVSIYYNIGMSYALAGDPARGKAFLQRFIQEAPGSMKEEKARARAALSGVSAKP